MRRLCAFGLFALGVAGVALIWPAARGRAPVRAGVRGPGAPKALGVSSCAAAACHHANGERGSKGSEYSTWVAVDPHAKAYRTLFKPESKAMHEALARGDASMAKARGAHENALCLKCHGAGDDAPRALHQDGIGCEQCHGPASRWKATHYLDGFDRATPGFRDLRDLAGRAETCLKCHVGDGTREVNHDLIAAGHPRLRFEYGAYYANYPRHWADTEKSRAPDMEARSWVVGQLAAAKGALELLAVRAGDEKRPWPEFSEYDCAACHHGLTKPSVRQQRDARGLAGRKAGELPWGTWYSALMPVLGEQVAGGDARAIAKRRSGIAEKMARRLPNRREVKAEATRAAKELAGWLTKAKGAKYTPEQVEALMRALAKQTGPLERGHDGGSQVYLGLAALHHARTDLDAAFKARSPLKAPLLGLRRSLYEAYPAGARPLYDSPLDYDPKKSLRALESIRDALK